MIADDLDQYLEDHGVPCNCGAVEFMGIVEKPDQALGLSGLHAQSTMDTVLVKTSVIAAAGIKNGSAITVDGVGYLSRVPAAFEDGAFSTIPLTKVTA